jgi:endonuclease YncB( thermonuclease family)
MQILLLLALLLAVTSSRAGATVIKDGDTLQLEGITHHLNGINAPERDQACLDEHGGLWACGAEARDRLTEYIGTRAVRCEDQGADRSYRQRRIGICSVEGETTSINRWLVQEGMALNFDPYARARFQLDQDDARQNRRGLWSGCFVAPWDLRY